MARATRPKTQSDMASKTYSEQVIVLRKTRLREADLILTMLAADGRQVRAVAKGALKPTGSFASRLELYAESRVLLVEGRSLDIVKEAKLENAHAELRFDYGKSICAAPVAELLAIATQDELPVPRLFDMTKAALGAIERAEGMNAYLCMGAFMLKAASILGFRPSLAQCVECGDPRQAGSGDVRFSYVSGGIVCADCAMSQPTEHVPGAIVDWAHALLHSTFAEILGYQIDKSTLEALLLFTRKWVETHIGSLRSLPFVLSEFR